MSSQTNASQISEVLYRLLSEPARGATLYRETGYWNSRERSLAQREEKHTYESR
jgi:hypothetical protein